MKTYTKEELNEVLRNHRHWLLQDCDGWEKMQADLSGAYLSGADLSGAYLYEADLRGADLRGARNVPFIPMVCPDSGEFTAWKKARDHIVKLLIPADAKRSSGTGRKCRCDKAIVLDIQKFDGAPGGIKSIESIRDVNFIYAVGATVSVPDFCRRR